MAKNEIFRNADHLGFPVATDVKSGDVVVIGELAGVAQTDYSGRDGQATIWLRGGYELPVSDATYTVGQPIYAHGAAGVAPTSGGKAIVIDGVATTGVLVGHSIESKTTTGGTGTLRVRLAA